MVGNSLERDAKIDNAKGFLILLVVAGHFLLPIKDRSRLLSNIFYLIYAFHMPAFVFISGILSTGVYKDKLSRFRIDKWFNILWLYIVFKIIVFFSEMPAYGQVTAFPDFFHESGAPWYLMCLLFWYLMIIPVSIIRKFMREEKREVILFICILFFALISGYMNFIRDFLSLDRVFSFAPFFFAGYFIGAGGFGAFVKERKFKNIRGLVITAGIISGFIILFFMFDRLLPYRNAVYGVWYTRLYLSQYLELYPGILLSLPWLLRIFWYVLSMVLGITFILLMPDKPVPMLSICGRRTLSIYILHRPVRDILLGFGFPLCLNPESKITVFLIFAISFILTVILATKPFYGVIDLISKMPNRLIKLFKK